MYVAEVQLWKWNLYLKPYQDAQRAGHLSKYALLESSTMNVSKYASDPSRTLMALLHSIEKVVSFTWNGNETPRHEALITNSFYWKQTGAGSSSSYAASVWGNPGPEVSALFCHWTCDGWTCRYRWREQSYFTSNTACFFKKHEIRDMMLLRSKLQHNIYGKGRKN